jgi:hypothetical protein
LRITQNDIFVLVVSYIDRRLRAKLSYSLDQFDVIVIIIYGILIALTFDFDAAVTRWDSRSDD